MHSEKMVFLLVIKPETATAMQVQIVLFCRLMK